MFLSLFRQNRLLTLLFVTPVFFPPVQAPRHHKASKKQVAMIAQKVVDANQTHRQRRPFIAFANARTTTLGTLLGKHSLTRRFSRPLCTVVRSQPRSQRRNLTFDFLSACNAHLVFYHVLIEVKERIFVAIDRATIVALED